MSINKRPITAAVLLAALALVGCEDRSQPSTGTPSPTITSPVVSPPQLTVGTPRRNQPAPDNAELAIAADANAFAADLYQQLATQEGNLFFSPASIHTALAMTYAGARGQTAEQMAGTMHYSTAGEPLHAAFEKFIEQLHSPSKTHAGRPTYALYMSNALWGQEGFPYRPEFVALNKQYYDAGLTSLDFRTDADGSRSTINQWVESKTNDKIKDLLAPGAIDADTRLVLTNAIYFKADWAEQFMKEATSDGDFHTADGTVISLPMMHDIKPGSVLQTDTFQAATLPYVGGDLSMTIYLPRERDGLPALEKQMTAKNLAQWQSQFKPDRINWTLPRWKFSSQFSLADTLAAMGMPQAFSDQADFTGMTAGDPLKISAVIHKAFIAVDEAGTEAAAATAVGMALTAAEVDEPVSFVVDHPFLFTIRHEATGAILFMGRVVNPQAE
jgi:serpin B